MTRQLYELNHPIYPHRDLRKHHEDHKILYIPYQGSYDDQYNNWYQIVRADHDVSGAPKRPIYREISQIMRQKSSGKEYLTYGESLIGFDHENNPIPFFHTYGTYIKPYFRTVYNYETRKASVIRSGQYEIVYFIEFSKDLLDQLYGAGPDNMDIELLVTVGSMQYGGRGFYTYDEFRDLSLEELARMGREGKGQFPMNTTNIPVGAMISQLQQEGTTTVQQQQQSNLYNEFQEFVRWKQQQQQPPPSSQKLKDTINNDVMTKPHITTPNIASSSTKFTIKEKDDKQQQQQRSDSKG